MLHNYLSLLLIFIFLVNCNSHAPEQVKSEPLALKTNEAPIIEDEKIDYFFDEVSALSFVLGGNIESHSKLNFKADKDEFSSEGETYSIPKTVVSDEEETLIDLIHAQDHRMGNYIEIVDEIIIHSEKLKNKEKIGVGNTIEKFFRTYPFAKVYYSYVGDIMWLDNGMPGYQFHLHPSAKIIDNLALDSDLIELDPETFSGKEKIKYIRIFGERGQADYSGKWFTKDKRKHATLQKKGDQWHINLVVGEDIYQNFSQELILKDNMLFSDPASDNQIQVKKLDNKSIYIRLDDHPEFEPMQLILFLKDTQEKPKNILSDAFVKNFTEERGRIFVEIDFVELEEIENGFEIKNDNPKTWVYELTKESYQDCRENEQSTYDIWKKWETTTDNEQLYWIKIENNTVTEFYIRECAG